MKQGKTFHNFATLIRGGHGGARYCLGLAYLLSLGLIHVRGMNSLPMS